MLTLSLDLNNKPMIVTIPAGATSATVTVPTFPDKLGREGAESVTITLGTPDNAAVTVDANAGLATGTINDTTKLTVSISDAVAVDEGQSLQFTVSLTGGTSTTAHHHPVDLRRQRRPLRLTSTVSRCSSPYRRGQRAPPLPCRPSLTPLVEGAEDVTITLVTPSNPAVTVTDGEGQGSINDTTKLTVSISDALAVDEGQSLQFTVSLTGGTATTPITIPLTYGGSADPVLDLDRPARERHHTGGCDQRHH